MKGVKLMKGMIGLHRSWLALCVLVLLSGCSSHYMAMEYAPTHPPVVATDARGVAAVGVTDSRGTPDNWLGAIRGGYGNPVKKLYTDASTAQVVRDAFEEALAERRLLDPPSSNGIRLEVDILKLDTSYYFNKEAHAHLNMTVYGENGRMIYQGRVREDRERPGVGAGIFGDVEALADFANETLNAAIDEMLNDPRLLAALE